MNRTPIEWTEFTWNPVTGCLHGCPYCYAAKIAKRFKKNFPNGFKPTFHPERIDEIRKIQFASTVFVCSMADLFGAWVPFEWQTPIFQAVDEMPWIIFQFLTKNPKGMTDAILRMWGHQNVPLNAWWGMSYTGQGPFAHVQAMPSRGDTHYQFVSFEPLLAPVPKAFPIDTFDWIIIGAQTNPTRKPDPAWVQDLIDRARDAGIAVFLKDSIIEMGFPEIREFPGDEGV